MKTDKDIPVVSGLVRYNCLKLREAVAAFRESYPKAVRGVLSMLESEGDLHETYIAKCGAIVEQIELARFWGGHLLMYAGELSTPVPVTHSAVQGLHDTPITVATEAELADLLGELSRLDLGAEMTLQDGIVPVWGKRPGEDGKAPFWALNQWRGE